MAHKVTIDGRVGRIDIIPDPKNAYLRLDTGELVGPYSFTYKEPAMPGTISPEVGGRSDGYLVGGTLAWIPGHNATFTPAATVPPDIETAIAERDDEWTRWVLDGAPSEEL